MYTLHSFGSGPGEWKLTAATGSGPLERLDLAARDEWLDDEDPGWALREVLGLRHVRFFDQGARAHCEQVQLSDGRHAVLRSSPSVRRAEIQKAAHAGGAPVPQVLEHGHEPSDLAAAQAFASRLRADRPDLVELLGTTPGALEDYCSRAVEPYEWMLMEFVPGVHPTRAEARKLLPNVVRALAQLHATPVTPSGLMPRAGWGFGRLFDGPRSILAGDMHVGNVIVTPSSDGSKVTLIDVAGDAGPGESDIARWCLAVYPARQVIAALREAHALAVEEELPTQYDLRCLYGWAYLRLFGGLHPRSGRKWLALQDQLSDLYYA